MSQQWIPAEVDTETPSAARMYDYFLGGAYNFDCDRKLANRVIEQFPDILVAARTNRDFVMRAVRYLTDLGIDQILDLGCGLPSSSGAVHEMARARNPEARVLYVDNEPVAVQHGLLMLDGIPGVEIIQADLRYPETFLNHAVTRHVLDFTRPVAVLFAAVLHFIQDADNPTAVVSSTLEALAPGSALVISHVTAEGDESIDAVRRLYEQSQNPGQVRTRDEVSALLAGCELVDPGVVWVPQWRPEGPLQDAEQPERSHLYGAVGIRR